MKLIERKQMPLYLEKDCDCDGERENVLSFENICNPIDCPDCGKKDAIVVAWETEYDLDPIEGD